jgi:hypothetical protein
MQVILAGWNNFRGMIAGFEVINEDKNLHALTNQNIELQNDSSLKNNSDDVQT